MATSTNRHLHWTQRIALVRHNLHSASMTGNFAFFKTLQAADLVDGTNHVAMLSSVVGHDPDSILRALDNLSVGLAIAHQDAFERVYNSSKKMLQDHDSTDIASKLHDEIVAQSKIADAAIDRFASSTVCLIEQVAPEAQEYATDVWITGVTIVSDSMEVVIRQMRALDRTDIEDTRLEMRWEAVKTSVSSTVSGLRGIFFFMDPATPSNESSPHSKSIAEVGSAILRRFSNAFQTPGAGRASSVNDAGKSCATTDSLKSACLSPKFAESDVNSGPLSRTSNSLANFKLNAIPATPVFEDQVDPFDKSGCVAVPSMAASAGQRAVTTAIV